MRSPTHAFLLAAALSLPSVCLSACGGAKASTAVSRPHTSTGTNAPVSQRNLPIDSDEDNDNPTRSHYDSDDLVVLQAGHPAGAADSQAIAGVVKGYYSAAAAGKGAKACSLIYTPIAENAPETVGPGRDRETCATAMTRFFKVNHRQFAADVVPFRVTVVRVDGEAGIVLARLGSRERRVLVHRDGRSWRVKTLMDMGVP